MKKFRYLISIVLLLLVQIVFDTIKLFYLDDSFALIAIIFSVISIILYFHYVSFFRRQTSKYLYSLVLLPIFDFVLNVVICGFFSNVYLTMFAIIATLTIYAIVFYFFCKFNRSDFNVDDKEKLKRKKEELLSTNLIIIIIATIAIVLNFIYGKVIPTYIISSLLFIIIAIMALSRYTDFKPNYKWQLHYILEILAIAASLIIAFIFGDNVIYKIQNDEQFSLYVFPIILSVILLTPCLITSKKIANHISKIE